MRFRNVYVVLGSIVVLALWFLTDPDLGLIQHLPAGSALVSTLLFMSKGLLGSSLLYITRKAMFDYDIADFEKLGDDANDSPEGAGLYAVAISIQTLAYALVIVGAFIV